VTPFGLRRFVFSLLLKTFTDTFSLFEHTEQGQRSERLTDRRTTVARHAREYRKAPASDNVVWYRERRLSGGSCPLFRPSYDN
jgi:hypothetical protein